MSSWKVEVYIKMDGTHTTLYRNQWQLHSELGGNIFILGVAVTIKKLFSVSKLFMSSGYTYVIRTWKPM